MAKKIAIFCYPFKIKKEKPRLLVLKIKMVPLAGFEPARLSALDFESSLSTDFNTVAYLKYYTINSFNWQLFSLLNNILFIKTLYICRKIW